MEKNYFEKVHQNEITSKREIQTIFTFNTSKTSEKEISKRASSFVFKKHIKLSMPQLCQFSIDPNCLKKVHGNDVDFSPKVTISKVTVSIFQPSKLYRRKHVETTSVFRTSKLYRRKCVEVTLISHSSKLYRKGTSNWHANLSIFSFRGIGVILATNRHWFDVLCLLGI